MKTSLIHNRPFLAISLGVLAAVSGAGTLIAGVYINPAFLPQACLFAITGAALSLLLLGLAACALSRRMDLLENTEIKFQSLLESAPDPMVILDGNGRLVMINAQAEKLFGYRREELLAKPIDELIRQEEQQTHFVNSVNDYRLSSTRQAGEEPEILARRKDGSQVPVDLRFSPVEMKDTTLTISIIRDVTERKTAEGRRAARHAVRRILADASSLDSAASSLLMAICESLHLDVSVLWTVDPQANALRCAHVWHHPALKGTAFQAACEVATFEPGAGLPGRVWASGQDVWLADLSEDSTAQRATAAVRLGLREAFGFPVMCGTEVLGVIECFSRHPLVSDEKLVDTLASMGTQIGRFIKYKHAEAAVRSSEARKAAVLEATPDAIITFDSDDNILEFNAAAERMFGHTHAAVREQRLTDLLLPPDLRDSFRQALAGYRVLGESAEIHSPHETRALRADGSEFPIQLMVTLIQGEGPALFSAYIRDLTEVKQAEEALRRTEEQFRQAQKMEAVGRLAGGIAHDFNNLLTVINGYTELLLEGLPEQDPLRGHADVIGKAGHRASGLVRQLLAFSRKQVLEQKVFRLDGVVNELQKMLQRVIGEDVSLATVAAPDLRPIKADPGQVEQVIMNLVVNARDAMPEGGKLTIETCNVDLDEEYAQARPEVRPGPYVLLAISDTGCGMDESTKARVFEPFFTTKEVGKGTGLGLATVYGIVKQSGGHIAVYSEPGHGTTFRVYLPCAEEEVALPRLCPPPAEAPRGKETLLLVEDEDMVRSFTSRVLQQNGYTVLEARDGPDALHRYGRQMNSVQLMVTDMVMPEMNGRDLAQRLIHRQPNLKVLFMSGYTDNAIFRSGLLDKGTAFIEKPFTPAGLARKVREVLSD